MCDPTLGRRGANHVGSRGVGYQKLAELDQTDKPATLSPTIMTGPEEILSLRHRQSQLALSEHLITYFRSLILSLSFIPIPQSHSHTSPRSALQGDPHAPHPFTITMRNDFAKQLKEHLVSRAIIRSGDDRLVREIEFLVPGLTA